MKRYSDKTNRTAFVLIFSLIFVMGVIFSWYINQQGQEILKLQGVTKNLELDVEYLAENLREQEGRLNENILELIPVVVTAYNPLLKQTDQTPTVTSSNKKVMEGMIALSRDLEERYNFIFGDEIYLLGLGKFVFEDRMNSKWKNRVDILMFSEKKAKVFGIQSSFLLVTR